MGHKYIIDLFIVFGMTIFFSQEAKDTNIIAIEKFFKSIKAGQTNREIMITHCSHQDYLTNDTIKNIADGWIDHLRTGSSLDKVIVKQYQNGPNSILFGITSINEKNVSIIDKNKVYAVSIDSSPNAIYFYLDSNKILSFGGFVIDNKLEFVKY